MLYTTYQVMDDIRVTLAPEVDRLYWRTRGQSIRKTGTTPSFGQAFSRATRRMSREPPVAGGAGTQRLEKYANHLQHWLGGQAFTREELDQALAVAGVAGARPDEGLQWLVLTGRAQLLPGVDMTGPAIRWRCNRCGAGGKWIRRGACARCEKACAWCDHCIRLGKSRACTPIVLIEPASDPVAVEKVTSILPLLSDPQWDAASRCLDWLEEEGEELLVQAVTGAGKTEMMFPMVRRVLEEGERVLWVAPRQEAVREVADRLRRSFPEIRVAELHGDSGDRWVNQSIAAATVQQAVRFYHRFRLAVVDEVEAYPLREEQIWQFGVRRAIRNEGKRVYLTATPPKSWLNRARRGKRKLVTVPARYHGFPLPVPRLHRVWRLQHKTDRGRPIPVLERFLKEAIEQKGQVLLFVPRVTDTWRLLRWFDSRMPGLRAKCGAVSSRGGERAEMVRRFMTGEVKVLITTTILERGVTVPRCHVAVVGADHPVFDGAALVQIAGRVGRSAAYQEGEVLFISSLRTEAQLRAVRDIRECNRLARRKGYLSARRYAL